MKPELTKRTVHIRRLNFACQVQREAERSVRDLDSRYLEPEHRLPFDPARHHAVTLESSDGSGRATCACGADTGWLPLPEVELRAHWHRREAEAVRSGPDRVEQSAPMFDHTLFAKLARHTRRAPARTPPVVPLPGLHGQQPLYLVFDDRDFAVELAYERHPRPGGTRIRSAPESKDYWIPRMTPVFAVSDGMIVYAREQGDGHTIVIDHGNDWLTVYHRLAHMFIAPTERALRSEIHVRGGHVLGYLAPSTPAVWRPLRFELWKRGAQHDIEQIDPLRYIRRWDLLDWGSGNCSEARP